MGSVRAQRLNLMMSFVFLRQPGLGRWFGKTICKAAERGMSQRALSPLWPKVLSKEN